MSWLEYLHDEHIDIIDWKENLDYEDIIEDMAWMNYESGVQDVRSIKRTYFSSLKGY